MELATGTVIDRYTVDSVLGEGGMAMVYLCKHNQLGTDHALKVLTMSSRAIRERLVQEGKVQASLRHANIVAVTDILAINGAPGLLMEYIAGPSLDDLIEQQALTYDQADHLMRGVMEGVAYAHEQGLVHRDLKPANIMLEVVAGSLVPKVTDFGLAKLIEGDTGRAATRTGSTMGTPHYMSPEQVADSKNVDHRTDVFALGAIMYEVLTGRRAFGGENLLQIFAAAAAGEFTPPRTLKPDLPQRMENAILGALEPDRDRRVQSVAELLAVWEGRAAVVGVVPVEPAGPFDADFMNSIQSMTGVSDAPSSPDPTWAGDLAGGDPSSGAQVSVVTLAQGPPLEGTPVPVVPVAASPSDTSAPSVPATSLVRGTTVVLGGGAAFLLGAVGLLALLGVGAGIAYFALVPSDPGIAVAVADPVEPEPWDDPDEVEAPPIEDPQPAPVRPVVAVPAPEPAPQPEPAAPEEPLDPEPVVEPEQPVEPEPQVVAAFAGAPDLDHAKPGRRMKAIDSVSKNPAASAKLVEMARSDLSSDVKVKAWQTIGARYREGIGDLAVQEALIVEALKSGRFSRREAANHYSRRGSDISLMGPVLAEGQGYLTNKSAVDGIVRIAQLHPSQVEPGKELLRDRLETAGGPLKGNISGALQKF